MNYEQGLKLLSFIMITPIIFIGLGAIIQLIN